MTNLSQAELPLLSSPAYNRADSDPEFLQRDDLRAVRLQLEWCKPELIQQDEGIESTIVVIGSARLLEPGGAKAKLLITEEEFAASPHGPEKNKESLRSRIRRLFLPITRKPVSLAVWFLPVVRLMGIANSSSSSVGPPVSWKRPIEVRRTSKPNPSDSILLYHYEQLPNPYITPALCFQFHYFALRKMHFLNRAKALVVFPGGFGRMDELFETLTLLQTGKVQENSVVLIGRDCWKDLINWKKLVEYGLIGAETWSCFIMLKLLAKPGIFIVAEHLKDAPS